MELKVISVFLLSLLAILVDIDRFTFNIGIKNPLVVGILSGVILSDIKLGVMVGSLMLISSLALDYVADVSMPNFSVATIIVVGLIYANSGLENYAIPTLGTLFAVVLIVLEIIRKVVNTVQVKSAHDNDIIKTCNLGTVFYLVMIFITTFLVLINAGSVGEFLIKFFVNNDFMIKVMVLFTILLPISAYASIMAETRSVLLLVLSLIMGLVSFIVIKVGHIDYLIPFILFVVIISIFVGKHLNIEVQGDSNE